MKNNNTSFFKSIEGFIFLIGCGLLIAEIILFIQFGDYIPELKEGLLPMIFADLLAGRAASISLGLEIGLSEFLVILISIIFNITLLFIFYPLIIYFYEHLIEIKIIGKVIGSAINKSKKYQSKIEKWGTLGLIFFVWIPFFSTGALVGAIIGTLIGMRTIVVICVVILGMISSAISWTFAFDYLFKFAEGAGKIIPTLFVGLILGTALFHRLYKLYRQVKQKIKLKRSSSSEVQEKVN